MLPSILNKFTPNKLAKLFQISTTQLNKNPKRQISSNISKLDIKNLWPIWINEYKNLKTWTDKQAYQRRYSLGEKYIFPIIGAYKPNQVTIQNVVDCLELAMSHTQQTHLKVLIALSQFLRWSTAKKTSRPQ